MQQYTYQVFKSYYRPKKMLLKDEAGQTLFLLQRQRHKLVAAILNAIVSSGLPYSYTVSQPNGKLLYSINCGFPGFRYKLIDHVSSATVPVVQNRVQLMEIAYSFQLGNRLYYFEKDFAGTGHLKCNNTVVAAVSMSNLINNSKLDVVHVEAENEETASLSAMLFHTFFYYNA